MQLSTWQEIPTHSQPNRCEVHLIDVESNGSKIHSYYVNSKLVFVQSACACENKTAVCAHTKEAAWSGSVQQAGFLPLGASIISRQTQQHSTCVCVCVWKCTQVCLDVYSVQNPRPECSQTGPSPDRQGHPPRWRSAYSGRGPARYGSIVWWGWRGKQRGRWPRQKLSSAPAT